MTVKIEDTQPHDVEHVDTKPIKKRKSPWRWLKRFIYTLLTLIVLVVGLVATIIFTEPGLKLVDYALKKSPISHMVQIDNIGGTLWEGIQFDRLNIVLNEQNHIEISHAKLQWDLRAILDKEVTVNSLSAGQVDVILTKPSDPAMPKPEDPDDQPFLPFSFTRGDLPVDIIINFAEAEKVAVMLPTISVYADRAEVNDGLIAKTEWSFNDVMYKGFINIGKDFTLPLDATATIVANRVTDAVNIRLKNSTTDMRIGDDYFDHAMSIIVTGTLNDLNIQDAITFNWPNQLAKPVVIEAKANIKDQADLSWDLTLFNVSNQLASTGEWSLDHPDRLTAKAELHLSQLKDAYPELSGSLNGHFSFAGDFKKPLLSGDLKGSGIKGFGLNLKSLDLQAEHNEIQTTEFLASLKQLQFNDITMKSAKIQLHAEKIEQFDFSAVIKNIVDKEKTLVDEIDLTSKGSIAEHSIALKIRSIFNTTDFEGTGQINPEDFKEWSLDINKLNVYSDIIGRYALSKPAVLKVSADYIDLSTLCLQELPTTICMQGHRKDQTGYGSFVIRRLQPKQLNSILPPEVVITTTADLVIAGSYTNKKNFTGVVDASLAPGNIRYRLQGYELNVPLKTTKAVIRAVPKEVTTELNVDWGDYLQIKGGGDIKDPMGKQIVNVLVKGEAPTLNWILPIVPSLQKLAGKLTMQLEATGRIHKDLNVGFNVDLANGEIYNAEYNTLINNINLRAVLNKGQPILNVTGGLTAGTGKLDLSGSLDLKNLESNLVIRGNSLLLADSSNVKVVASPNIDLKMSKTGVIMRGNLTIPELRFIYKSSDDPRGSVQKVSSDTVVISSTRKPVDKKNHAQFLKNSTVDFDIILGDNISVGAVGFVGKLTGNVDLKKQPDQPLRAIGIINMASGIYNVLGQELTLDKGRIQFTGLNLDDPNIEFQASRSFENKRTGSKVNVGVRVTGTAQNPKLNLFSQPTMQTNSIVSYLALGTDVDSLTAIEVLQIAKMAQRLSSGDIVTSQDEGFAKSVGLTDFGVMKDLAGNTSIGIGKYITNNFYVGVGFSVFEESNSAFGLMRYSFLKYFSFDAQVSDEYSTIDLRYTKEI